MKKILLIIISFFICLSFSKAEAEKYKVIRVIDGDTIYIDFNKNKKADKNERIRIDGIDAFEISISYGTAYQMKKYGYTLDEVIGLGYFGKEYAKKELLNKYVEACYTSEVKTDKYNRKLMSIKYDKNKDYAEEILKAGLAKVYTPSCLTPKLIKYENIDKIKQNALKTHDLKLVLLDKISNKYHKIDCEYAKKIYDKELIDVSGKINYKMGNCCRDN